VWTGTYLFVPFSAVWLTYLVNSLRSMYIADFEYGSIDRYELQPPFDWAKNRECVNRTHQWMSDYLWIICRFVVLPVSFTSCSVIDLVFPFVVLLFSPFWRRYPDRFVAGTTRLWLSFAIYISVFIFTCLPLAWLLKERISGTDQRT